MHVQDFFAIFLGHPLPKISGLLAYPANPLHPSS